MTDLHPHWHSTADDSPSPRTSSIPAAKSGVHVSVKPAARLPGAVVGIVTFALIGFTIAGGWETITAQVGGSSSSAVSASSTASVSPKVQLPPVEIHITGTTGFLPATVTIKPGQTITWVNDQSIPHILTSQTLRNGSGVFLNTPAIFPGSKESFTVGEKETDREHIVISTTDQALRGTVIVSSKEQTSSASSKKILGGTDGIDLPSGQGNRSSTTGPVKKSKSAGSRTSRPASSARTLTGGSAGAGTTTAPPAGTDGGSAQVFPPSQSAAPSTLDTFAPPSMGQNVNVPLSGPDNSYAPPNPQPNEQPHTGPGLWVVALISITVLWGVSRKYLVRLT